MAAVRGACRGLAHAVRVGRPPLCMGVRFVHTTPVVCGKKQEIPFDLYETRSFSIIAHIDHGKSTLADRLLERTNTIPSDGSNKQVLDKLKVERERGITIDLGYLYADLGEGSLTGFIDVPGHERFVHNMLAGASGIDCVLLVVAAMCFAAVATVGRQAATEAAVAAELSGPAARVLTVTDSGGTGFLTGATVATLAGLDAAEAALCVLKAALASG